MKMIKYAICLLLVTGIACIPFTVDVINASPVPIEMPINVERIGPRNSPNSKCDREFPKDAINDMKKIEEYIALCAEKSYTWYRI